MVSDPALRPAGLVVPTAIPGLSVLPIGRPAAAGPVSTERTVTRAVVDTIGRIARQFPQWVLVMDSPPCLATSDASTMAPAVGQIAMIVEAERTQRDDLEAALELLRPCPNITLILNKIRLVKDRAFGDYHYYDA
jgi:receptor protein-tyrosine kinase